MASLVHELHEAWASHSDAAVAAETIFATYAPNRPRVPGCDTVLRLAHRIYHGRSVEEAAAREYVYRWHVTLNSGRYLASHYAPHTLGL